MRRACPARSQFAEKLLANADGCHDRAVAYRDAFDLGMVVVAGRGHMPLDAIEKSVAAYGNDIWSKLRWVVSHLLGKPNERDRAALAMQMDLALANQAMEALRDSARCLDPDPAFDWDGV